MQGEVGTHPRCTNPKIVFDLWLLHDMATFDKVSKNFDSNIPATSTQTQELRTAPRDARAYCSQPRTQGSLLFFMNSVLRRYQIFEKASSPGIEFVLFWNRSAMPENRSLSCLETLNFQVTSFSESNFRDFGCRLSVRTSVLTGKRRRKAKICASKNWKTNYSISLATFALALKR